MRVVIADDEPTCRIVLRATVERLGHECREASDGQQAWDLLMDEPADVLVTDWMMPGLDGLELCRRLRENPTEAGYTYIILATALTDRQDIIAGMNAGADDYLTKPLNPFDVETRLIAATRVTELHHQVLAFRTQLESLNVELAQQARTDPLTQLGNRLRMIEDLHTVHARANRNAQPYSVAICDLDYFKAYNDAYGHLQGDVALQAVASGLRDAIRSDDHIYRYGGEEFVVILPDQPLELAHIAVERIRVAIEKLAFAHGSRPGPPIVTISAGIAEWHPARGESFDTVLTNADHALYEAKRLGRNRIEHFDQMAHVERAGGPS